MKHILSIITVFVLAGCSLPDTTVDSPTPPFITTANATLSVIDVGRLPDPSDTTIVVTASVTGINVTTVTALVAAPDGAPLTYLLQDNGATPDVKANDSIFTGSVRMHLSKAAVGQYNIQIQASGDAGLGSNIIALPVTIISSNNLPPVISQVIAPDTAVVPTNGSFSLIVVSVAVADPDGLASIASVSLTSVRPDGTTPGTFPMHDDGNAIEYTTFVTPLTSGDAVAGDGRYTLSIPLSGKVNAYYDFVFSAKDKSGAISNSLTKRIYIK